MNRFSVSLRLMIDRIGAAFAKSIFRDDAGRLVDLVPVPVHAVRHRSGRMPPAAAHVMPRMGGRYRHDRAVVEGPLTRWWRHLTTGRAGHRSSGQ
jgi:hypothetical protein